MSPDGTSHAAVQGDQRKPIEVRPTPRLHDRTNNPCLPPPKFEEFLCNINLFEHVEISIHKVFNNRGWMVYEKYKTKTGRNPI